MVIEPGLAVVLGHLPVEGVVVLGDLLASVNVPVGNYDDFGSLEELHDVGVAGVVEECQGGIVGRAHLVGVPRTLGIDGGSRQTRRRYQLKEEKIRKRLTKVMEREREYAGENIDNFLCNSPQFPRNSRLDFLNFIFDNSCINLCKSLIKLKSLLLYYFYYVI